MVNHGQDEKRQADGRGCNIHTSRDAYHANRSEYDEHGGKDSW